ncbi:MAG: hydroxymethylglutaryl-CoA reductase [archaeon]
MATNSDLSDSELSEQEREALEQAIAGKISLRRLDELVGKDAAVRVRRAALEAKITEGKGRNGRRTSTGSLDAIGGIVLDAGSCDANIEAMIGQVTVPIGVAGPLTVKGKDMASSCHIPLATTEGALVASVNRGCKTIEKSGGATVTVFQECQTRSLLFTLPSAREAHAFFNWVDLHRQMLFREAHHTSKHLSMSSIQPVVVGRNVWLRLHATTGDAMGMNMITVAGKRLGKVVSEQYPAAVFISESGNMCVDKKPSAMNLINGRGRSVVAEAIVGKRVIHDVLGSTPEALVDMNNRKNLLGSAASGSLGFNAQAANVIAAVFLATGQDIAHVVEGSQAITTIEAKGDGIHAAITIPSLQVGTVGGGTVLPAQHSCLDIIGVAGGSRSPGKHARRLAEVIAAACLAGELSLLASLSDISLSSSHERLNRPGGED